jgi:hypothetical protein
MRAIVLVLVPVLLAGCATAPRQTLAGLNRHDPEYASRACRQARREAARFDEHKDGRIALAVAGNLVVPLAGTAAAAAVAAAQEDRKHDLNQQLKAKCISDPLAGRREARR